jgi:hypothetical protein
MGAPSPVPAPMKSIVRPIVASSWAGWHSVRCSNDYSSVGARSGSSTMTATQSLSGCCLTADNGPCSLLRQRTVRTATWLARQRRRPAPMSEDWHISPQLVRHLDWYNQLLVAQSKLQAPRFVLPNPCRSPSTMQSLPATTWRRPRLGYALGVAEQYLAGADLCQQRRKPATEANGE